MFYSISIFRRAKIRTLCAYRVRTADWLILLALVLAFLDESIRKVLPDQPVIVTGVKDLLIYVSGILVWANPPPGHRLYRYVKNFALWVIYAFFSSLFVFYKYGSFVHLLSCLRTYCLFPLVFYAGYYVGSQKRMYELIKMIFICGFLVSAFVGILQEFIRDSLPPILSSRIYKDKHSLAGGKYVESIFASPTIFAMVNLVVLMYLLGKSDVKRPGSIIIDIVLSCLSLWGLYESRIRVSIFLLGVGCVLLFFIRFGTVGYSKLVIYLGVAVIVILLIIGNLISLEDYYQKDIQYYSSLISIEEIGYRVALLDFERRMFGGNWIFGNGAGTGGPLRQFLGVGSEEFVVHDTGFFLIYSEFGLIGLMLMLYAMINLSTYNFRMFSPSGIKNDIGNHGLMLIPVLSLLWFIFKSHPIFANSMSVMIWVGGAGIIMWKYDSIGA